MKGNPQKKETFQDNFIHKFGCSAHNHPEGFSWWKRKARKDFRRLNKKRIEKEILL